MIKKKQSNVQKNTLLSYKSIVFSISKIAIPISIQMALISGLQLIDNFFIGNLKQATHVASGVNAINNISFIISSLIIGFISGIGVYMIHSSSSKNVEIKHNIFKVKLAWLLIFSISIIIPASIFIKQISMLWLSENNQMASNFANEYGQIIMPALFLGFVSIVFSSTLKEVQKIKITVIISVIAFTINSILNYVFMYVLNLGVKGAGIATIIARFIEVSIWFIYILIKKPEIIPKITEWHKITIHKIFFVFPKCFLWMVNQFLLSLVFTIQILVLSRISIESGASLSSAGAILQLIRAFVVGYAHAISIMIIFLIGKQKIINSKSTRNLLIYIKKLSILSFLFGLIIGIMGASLSPLSFYIYPKYSYYTNINSIIMIISASLLMSINLLCDVPIAALKGMGVSKPLILFDALFGWFISLPIVLCLTYIQGGLLDFGWIYLIAGATNIFKPFLLFKYALKFIKKGKILNAKGLINEK